MTACIVGWGHILFTVRGRVVMEEDEVLGAPAGAPVRFLECLPKRS